MKPRAVENGDDKARLPADSPLLLDSFLARLKRDYGPKANPWVSARSFLRSRLPDPRVALARNAPLFSDRTAVFFIAAAALVYLRMMYRTTYFPIFVEGEESKVLDLAKATVDYASYMGSWWSAFTGGLIEYNKGYAWFLVPFYMLYGYDVRIMFFVLPALSSVLIALFYSIYRKSNPGGSLLSFVVVSLLAILCVSLRRYKWHSVAYIAVTAIYVYFLPLFYAGAGAMRDRWRKGIAAALFVLSCYLYFGCLFYALPFLLLVFVFRNKGWSRRDLAAFAAGAGLCALAFLATYGASESWRAKIAKEIASVGSSLTRQGVVRQWWSTRDFLLTQDLSIPYLVIFIVGAIVSWRRIRAGDAFATVNSVLLSCIWVFQSPVSGLNNPDKMNWSMIPLLGLLLIGCDAIVTLARAHLRHGLILCGVAAALTCWNEQRHYLELNRDAPYQAYTQDRNTRSEIALILRMIREDDSGSVQYFLPEATVPEARGGFDYRAALLRVDTPPALEKVQFFSSEADLSSRLAALHRGKKAVVFLSVGFVDDVAKDTISLPLLGHLPEIIHPYERIYGIPFMVRRFTFEPGVAPGPTWRPGLLL
jgi:hypothetical protein